MANQVSIPISSKYLYWLYLFLFLGVAVLAFVAKLLPMGYGLAGLSTLAIAVIGTVADDFTEQKVPDGLPYWVTYLVMTAVMAFVAAIGQFTSQTVVTDTAFISWIILVLGAIASDLAQDAGANAPQYIETLAHTVIGGFITFLTWFTQNPMATEGAIVATGIAVVINLLETTGLLNVTVVASASTAKPSTP